MKSICCPRCLHLGWDLIAVAADGSPRFKCRRCAETWTCDKNGGPYLDAAKKPGAVGQAKQTRTLTVLVGGKKT